MAGAWMTHAKQHSCESAPEKKRFTESELGDRGVADATAAQLPVDTKLLTCPQPDAWEVHPSP